MPQFTTYEETAEDICKLLKTDIMLEIIKDQMEKRDEERRKKFGTPSDFCVPKVTYKFDDVVKKYDSGMSVKDIMDNAKK